MNIYVGNLSFDATQPDLESLFSTHGKIDDVRLITDRYSAGRRASASSRCRTTTRQRALSRR